MAEVTRWMRASKLAGAFVGAVGVSLQGYVRATNDVDLMVYVPGADPARLLESLLRRGFSPREPDPVEFARENHILLMKYDATGVKVDIALGMFPVEEEIAKTADTMRLNSQRVPVASVEALCFMKIIAARARDVQDVRGLVEIHPDLDRAWIMNNVRQYAELLDAPDRIDIAEKLLGVTQSAYPPGEIA